MENSPRRRDLTLPARVRSLFWEYGDREISFRAEPDLVIGRVLSSGDWESVRWVRREAGDAGIREYLERTRGRALSPRQLRLWQVLLDLPEDLVTGWLGGEGRRVWDGRAS